VALALKPSPGPAQAPGFIINLVLAAFPSPGLPSSLAMTSELCDLEGSASL
jgi:hypothetical protein